MPGFDDQDYYMNVCAPLANFDPPNSWKTDQNGMVAAWEENPKQRNQSQRGNQRPTIKTHDSRRAKGNPKGSQRAHCSPDHKGAPLLKSMTT